MHGQNHIKFIEMLFTNGSRRAGPLVVLRGDGNFGKVFCLRVGNMKF